MQSKNCLSLSAAALLLCSLFGLSACEQNKVPPLTARQKADYLLEIIPQRPECEGLRQRLRDAPDDYPSVEKVYQDAIKTRCTHREV